MTEHRLRVEELVAEYRRSRAQLAEVHQQLARVSATAQSAEGLVTATVGARGQLVDLVLDPEVYTRYRPSELAAHIVRAVNEATAEAFSGAEEVLTPALGRGVDPGAVLSGTADLSDDELAEADAGPDDGGFEDHNWIDDSEWSKTR
ncbi:YbaB/EbfC family nucleoid-associated protein [Saccharomonospora sp. NB11]|uniref:YbaB/EbfC family nucleoid-associated protein n=1 Tax=Saccharomonospora sp. NB11 TaxID=1642298 RepID=UPI0018D03BA4|nr:YbaB/EbfC family nucleoid-associated protein [Saccharomonospora sp. NB11]